MRYNICRYDTLPSTNTFLKELSYQINSDITNCNQHVIVAREQTGGRGRLGKSFVSKKDAGLYFSTFYHFDDINNGMLLSIIAGLSVCEAICELYGWSPSLKWPNDVLLDSKKICGILAEVGGNSSVILGIGINVSTPQIEFDQEGLFHVSSLFEITKKCVPNERLLDKVLDKLEINMAKSHEDILGEYRKVCTTIGKKIVACNVEAIAVAVDDCGRLIARGDNGEEMVLNSGEVSITGIY